MKFKIGDKVKLIDDPLKRNLVETVEQVLETYTELIATDHHPLTNAGKFKKVNEKA